MIKQKKAQMKIQEMAFVLIAIMIFFAMVALVYFAIRLSSMTENVQAEREASARELARKLADIPEFSWAECSGCVDADKVLALKDRVSYRGLWDVDYLMVEKIYPNATNVECTIANYPNCRTITLVNKTKDFGVPASAFVALCSYDASKGGYERCGLGKIYASAKAIK
jgi:hypothetical protein